MTTCPHCKKSFTLRRQRPGTLIARFDAYKGLISAGQILKEHKDLRKNTVYEMCAEMIRQGAWKSTGKRGYYIATPRKMEVRKNATAD